MNENDIALISNGSESENTSSDRSSDQLLLTDVNSSRSSNSDDELLGLCVVSFYSADRQTGRTVVRYHIGVLAA